MEDFLSEHQDGARNALTKSLEAGFLAWKEELKADQVQFQSEKILTLGFQSSWASLSIIGIHT